MPNSQLPIFDAGVRQPDGNAFFNCSGSHIIGVSVVATGVDINAGLFNAATGVDFNAANRSGCA